MKMVDFAINNYKSLLKVEVELGDYTVFVGANGAGKTNISELLYLFFTDFAVVGGAASPMLREESSWHNKEGRRPIDVSIRIELSGEELQGLLTEDVATKIMEKRGAGTAQLAVHRQIAKPGEPWRTKNLTICDIPFVKEDQVVAAEELSKVFGGEPAMFTMKPAKAYLFDPGADQSNLVGPRLIVVGDTAFHMGDASDELVRSGQVPFEKVDGVSHTEWASQQGLTLVERPPSEEDLWVRETSLVPAKALQEMQSRIESKVRGRLTLIPATRDELVPPGTHGPFVSRSGIINPLSSLPATDERKWHKIRTIIESLVSAERLDPTPELCTWEGALRLSIAMIGGGEQEIIGLIWHIISNPETILVIEEPESHLHYDLSKKLFRLLVEESKERQVLVLTHSEQFADFSQLDNNWIVAKKGIKTEVKKCKAKKDLIEAFDLLGATPADRGFANKVLFVAGETELDVLPIWVETIGANVEEVRIEVLAGERDRRKVKVIQDYTKDTQTKVFLMVDHHASDEVKQALSEGRRLILEGTIEDCYPVSILLDVLNGLYGLKLTEEDIDPDKPRVEEIQRILKEKRGISKKNTFWKPPVGRQVAKRMSREDIPEYVREFMEKILA